MSGAIARDYGPWAVIAGASEGTGAAFARLLAGEGLNLFLVARREGPLRALAGELRDSHGVEVFTGAIDLSRDDGCAAMAQALAAHGVPAEAVGLFVANAGSDPHGSLFLELPLEDWQALVRRNVMTTLACCHHFGATMRQRPQRRGGLLLVGSGASYGGGPMLGVYAGTKAFEMCLAEGLWAELGPQGIEVLYLSLGRTDTPELRRLLSGKGLPLPPGLASPEEVARVGMARLAHGPIHNWGQADDDPGPVGQSAAQRRARVEMIAAASRAVLGGN